MNFNIDLKNIDLKNITMDDIKAKLQKVEKKTWIKIGVSFGAVILFLIIYYGISPHFLLNQFHLGKNYSLHDIAIVDHMHQIY